MITVITSAAIPMVYSIDSPRTPWSLKPRGYLAICAIVYGPLLFIPSITASIAVYVFMWSHYVIKFDEFGVISKLYQTLGKDDDDRPFIEKLGFSNHKRMEIIGWPEDKHKRRKVKIGGLGVMSSFMGKSMTDVDLIWAVPKVKDIGYPPSEPIEVIIFGEPHLIKVEKHILDNIAYVILDPPAFRAQIESDTYPARMDDLSSVISNSTWNQAIAITVHRNPNTDIYLVNYCHGILAPIYLVPKALPIYFSLHNAEFQTLWSFCMKDEMKQVCSAFNTSKEHHTKYIQFGNTFNLLHATTPFISEHQDSVGVAGVSDKYGKRSWIIMPLFRPSSTSIRCRIQTQVMSRR